MAWEQTVVVSGPSPSRPRVHLSHVGRLSDVTSLRQRLCFNVCAPGVAPGTARAAVECEFQPWPSSPPPLSPVLGNACAPRRRGRAEAVDSPSPLSWPSADGFYEIGGLLPVWAVVVIAGTALAAVTFFATSNSEPPGCHWVRILSSPAWEAGPWNLAERCLCPLSS